METEEIMHISDVLKSAVIEIGYKKKAVRDGSGPNKNSYRRQSGNNTGRRKASGESCPKRLAPKK